MHVPYVVGLTGGIGSGKTEVARAFAALGVDVADADEAAHAVTAQGEAGYRAVIDMFGPKSLQLDGSLDRAWLRQTVFADADARAKLERLLHPMILDRLAGEMAGWTGAYGLLSVPLLLERGNARSRVARVVVVDCPEDEQVRRVMARSNLTAQEVRAIMATQLPRSERLAQADDMIDNGGPIAALGPQVARLDAFYRQCARRALEPARRSPDNGAH